MMDQLSLAQVLESSLLLLETTARLKRRLSSGTRADRREKGLI
jgi:hypothetical protein